MNSSAYFSTGHFCRLKKFLILWNLESLEMFLSSSTSAVEFTAGEKKTDDKTRPLAIHRFKTGTSMFGWIGLDGVSGRLGGINETYTAIIKILYH